MYLSLCGGLRLISEDHVLAEFSKLGFTRKTLRILLRKLGVPYLIVNRRIRFIDQFSLVLAFRTALLPFAPDFLAPTSTPADLIDRESPSPDTYRTAIGAPEVRSRLDETVSLLVAARHISGLSTSIQFVDELRESASRIESARGKYGSPVRQRPMPSIPYAKNGSRRAPWHEALA